MRGRDVFEDIDPGSIRSREKERERIKVQEQATVPERSSIFGVAQRFIKRAAPRLKKISRNVDRSFTSSRAGERMVGREEKIPRKRLESGGTFVTAPDGNLFGTMQHRNIHEGVGRNVWEDKPKKTIWDK